MKFYKYKYNFDYFSKIYDNKLNAIYLDSYFSTRFLKNGVLHNAKNVAYFCFRYKDFYLNGKVYGNQDDFTKETWRKFCKLKAFL